ncbi:hypothetical protein SN4111_06470 [Ligilactobacillus agilis]|nr:hypothetical protein SN4111_06470 [Ligilactobacillus agilis]
MEDTTWNFLFLSPVLKKSIRYRFSRKKIIQKYNNVTKATKLIALYRALNSADKIIVTIKKIKLLSKSELKFEWELYVLNL